MMRAFLIAAVLVGGARVAAADCKAEGEVLFHVTHDHIASAKQPVIDTVLYANGAWTFTNTNEDGVVSRTAHGCLKKSDLAAIAKEIDAVPWKIEERKVRCMAMAQTFTRYAIHGTKVEYKKRMCGEQMLDDKSSKVLDEVEKKLDSVTAP